MEELQELGLSRNEEKVYLTLLDIGEAKAGDVAAKAQIHRRNTYDSLKKLVEKGLISYVLKGKRKHYSALHPKRIVDIQREKLHLSKAILPELLTTYNLSKAEQEVQTLEGIEGMKAFFLDFVEGKGERMVLGATGAAYEKLRYFFPQVLKRLQKVRPIKTLWVSDAKKRRKIEEIIPSKNRTLPGRYSSPTQIFIYQDKTAVTIWSDRPIIIIIKSKEIQSGFRKYFDFLWHQCS